MCISVPKAVHVCAGEHGIKEGTGDKQHSDSVWSAWSFLCAYTWNYDLKARHADSHLKIWKAEAGGFSWILGQPWLHSEFQAIMDDKPTM